VPLPFPDSEGDAALFPPPSDEPEVLFAQAFTRLQGRFAFCANEQELDQQLRQLLQERAWTRVYCNELPWSAQYSNTTDLENCHTSITGCEMLVARTGTIVLSSTQQGGRTASVYAPVHICIARTSQIVYDVKDALQELKNRYGSHIPSFISFASGPSRTADIEKTLVTGVHGPKEVYVFLVEGKDELIIDY
jgi:L-lactate dehydrogenase complex protein LldG